MNKIGYRIESSIGTGFNNFISNEKNNSLSSKLNKGAYSLNMPWEDLIIKHNDEKYIFLNIDALLTFLYDMCGFNYDDIYNSNELIIREITYNTNNINNGISMMQGTVSNKNIINNRLCNNKSEIFKNIKYNIIDYKSMADKKDIIKIYNKYYKS